MHEFDRFVRQNLKLQAYVRYGDDYILFCRTRRQAYHVQAIATNFLKNKLSLAINPKNNVVAQTRAGLKFLGHAITKDFFVVDKHTTTSVLGKLDWHNAASYRALPLVKNAKARSDWILLEKYVDI